VMVSMRGLLNGLQRALVTNVADGNTGTLQVHRKGYMKNVVSTPLSLDFPAAELIAKIRETKTNEQFLASFDVRNNG